MTVLPWCFLFPVVTLVLSALGLPRRAGAASWLAPLSVFACGALWLLGDHATVLIAFDGWAPFLPDPAFRLTLDALAAIMLVVVGGVATCVYVYSLGYMADDPRAHRFFAFLDFFVASMTLLVVAGNLSVLLLGWAGVGVASFLLISFWWTKDGGAPLRAGFLALGANAIGDAALLAAVVLMPAGAGALSTLHTQASLAPGGAALIGSLLLVAACAKSAQGPLWWWLPSAMAGPTPVSALIHAATMVAAGVYLLVRTSKLLALSETVLWWTAAIGTATAVCGGIASLWQHNFKRGLAYSTVSQLGWMFAAVGVGAPFAALFHLVTHASFKAMLFLSAGTVIHATHHEEDLEKLGGLRTSLPFTFGTFILGTLALIGTPLVTAGSFSKDAILEAAMHPHSTSFAGFGALLLGSTVLTGAYAGRLLFGVFFGKQPSTLHDVHQPGALFMLPLVPLALGAIGLGYLGAPMSALLTTTIAVPHLDEPFSVTLLGLGAFGLGLVGVGLGALIARSKSKRLPAPPASLTQALLGEAQALPEGVAALHSGHVGRYALIGLIGTALLVAAALRPVDAAPSTAKATSSPARPRSPFELKGMEQLRRVGDQRRQLLEQRQKPQPQQQQQPQPQPQPPQPPPTGATP